MANNCPSDPALHRYHAGEMGADEAAQVREHLAQCEACARRDAEIVAAHDQLVGQVQDLDATVAADQAAVDAVFADRAAGAERVSSTLAVAIEGYEILREVHRGGQGIVYQAVQRATKRKVAIKVLLEGPFASKTARKRFEREIELVANLKHPNIIAVFHSGETTDGRAYCVMDYVRGLRLDQYVRQKKLTLEEALKLFAGVCDAVNYAHQKGVIHRDLKPANILVDSDGTPKVLDFGLARSMAGGETTLVSVTGQVVGTLPYMSPEQARGNPDEIDTRTDLYALGVILYELLTGHYPYPVVGQMADVLRHIAETEPTPPSRRWKQDSGITHRSSHKRRFSECPIDDEVQTIVLKSLSKERERRYQSAGELARDISHYLAGEPIEAKRDSAFYVLRKQLRRYRAPAAIACLFLVMLIVFGVVMSFQAERNRKLAKTEEEAKLAALASREEARRATTQMAAAKAEAEARAESLRRKVYLNDIALAQSALDGLAMERMQNLLEGCPVDLRCWAWYRLKHLSDPSVLTLSGHTDGIHCVAFSPDGRHIASGSHDATLKVWHLETGEEVFTNRLQSKPVWSVAFSPDGRRIVSGCGDTTVRIFDSENGEELLTCRGHAEGVESVAYSADGRQIISGSGDKTVRIWCAATGRELLTLRGHVFGIYGVALSPDNTRIVSVGGGSTIKVWDAQSGEELRTIGGHADEDELLITSVSFSPDGSRIVTGNRQQTIKVWSAESGEEILTLRGHTDVVKSVDVSPCGKRIVSGSWDNTIKLWHADTGEEILTLPGHSRSVQAVAFSPDGGQIVSGGLDRTLKLWTPETDTLKGHTDKVTSVAVSPDGNRIASASEDKTLKIWDAATGEEFCTLRGHAAPVTSVAWSANGQRVVSGSSDHTLKVWCVDDREELLTLRGHSHHVHAIALSPDGKRVVSASRDRSVKLWDTETGQEILTFHGHSVWVFCVAFSPDGRRIVSGGWDRTLKVWDAVTGEELLTLGEDLGRVPCVAFSPDGKRIASGAIFENTLRVWDADTGAELFTCLGHTGGVATVAFSPDGKRIVSAGRDRTVQLWDAETGESVLTLRGHLDRVSSVTFSPDGTQIVSGSADRTVKIWDAGLSSRMWRATSPVPP